MAMAALIPVRRRHFTPEAIARIRENSRKSTGPKDCSIVRFNGLTHGLRTQFTIIPGEDPYELEQLRSAVFDTFIPIDDTETELAEQIVFAMWRLRRARNAEKIIIEKHSGLDGTRWRDILDADYLDKITKYENHAHNQISRAMEALLVLYNRKPRRKNKENKGGDNVAE